MVVIIIGLLSWMGVARLVRAEVLTLRERDFVSAASFAVGNNILTEASLSYLGLGVQVPTPSWGNMLQDALEPCPYNIGYIGPPRALASAVWPCGLEDGAAR